MDLRPLSIPVVAWLACTAAHADKIHRMDGSAVTGVTIVAERLGGVEYKDDKRKDGTVPADDVLAVEYEAKPQLIDRAEAAIEEEAYRDAQVDLLNFLEGLDEAPRKFPWSRAYAIYRLIEVDEVLGELGEVAKLADRLAKQEPDSRYLPMAQLKKAQALFDSGKAADAVEALGVLKSTIDANSLGERWKLEHELSATLFDPALKGEARATKIRTLAGRAANSPVVRNRANAALGEALLSAGKAADAEKLFRAIVEDPKGDGRTLAAAYTGLGDCLYSAGEGRADTSEGKAKLNEALLSYMRVIVSHKNQLAYVPKAMFYAGRCIQLAAQDLEDQVEADRAAERAEKLFVKLIRTFPDSRWASEARGFRKR